MAEVFKVVVAEVFKVEVVDPAKAENAPAVEDPVLCDEVSSPALN